MFSTYPINDECLDCGKKVDPQWDRQELAWDAEDNPRRRCGSCINKLKQQKDKHV